MRTFTFDRKTLRISSAAKPSPFPFPSPLPLSREVNASPSVSYKEALQSFSPLFSEVQTEAEDVSDDERELDFNIRVITLSKEEKLSKQATLWNYLLIKVSGLPLPTTVINERINALCKPSGRLQIIFIDGGFYLVRLDNKADYDKALHGGPWFIGQKRSLLENGRLISTHLLMKKSDLLRSGLDFRIYQLSTSTKPSFQGRARPLASSLSLTSIPVPVAKGVLLVFVYRWILTNL